MSGSGRFDEDNDPVFQQVGICQSCKHRRSGGKCRAYPDGIPVDILVGNVFHTVPLPGDHGIQYEAIIV
jgi:hypothetical protein